MLLQKLSIVPAVLQRFVILVEVSLKRVGHSPTLSALDPAFELTMPQPLLEHRWKRRSLPRGCL